MRGLVTPLILKESSYACFGGLCLLLWADGAKIVGQCLILFLVIGEGIDEYEVEVQHFMELSGVCFFFFFAFSPILFPNHHFN